MVENKQNYLTLRFIGGVCALAGGATMMAFDLRGGDFPILGLTGIALGATLLFSLSKNK